MKAVKRTMPFSRLVSVPKTNFPGNYSTSTHVHLRTNALTPWTLVDPKAATAQVRAPRGLGRDRPMNGAYQPT